MRYDYDLIVIGLGPAGMAVSIMAGEMGLKVCGIEKNKLGGECMNVGCIPSKALLRMGKYRHMVTRLKSMSLEEMPSPNVLKPFERIQEHLDFIREKKTKSLFEKIDLVYQQGAAEFVDPHTVQVGSRKYTARRIFICVGSKPSIPDFPGIKEIKCLTNETMFSLDHVPESMIVIGGGAIACEMAQAFSRLGTQVTMIIRGSNLIWREDSEVYDLLEKQFESEGITILRKQKPTLFKKTETGVIMETSGGQRVEAEYVLAAAGRTFSYEAMRLDKAGVKTSKRGEIIVNDLLQTTQSNIYAAGDCNGYALFSHAAMHQGMIALMNSMLPPGLKKKYKTYTVPWTIFTDPQISHTGMTEKELKDTKKAYQVVKVNYSDYGAAIAESLDVGFIKAFVGPTGRIYGTYIVGEGSGDMINEWSLAIQKKVRMQDILMLQHSFPTMSFLTKRISEVWMMSKMKKQWLKRLCRFMFRF